MKCFGNSNNFKNMKCVENIQVQLCQDLQLNCSYLPKKGLSKYGKSIP
jgi:hypothetical protein